MVLLNVPSPWFPSVEKLAVSEAHLIAGPLVWHPAHSRLVLADQAMIRSAPQDLVHRADILLPLTKAPEEGNSANGDWRHRHPCRFLRAHRPNTFRILWQVMPCVRFLVRYIATLRATTSVDRAQGLAIFLHGRACSRSVPNRSVWRSRFGVDLWCTAGPRGNEPPKHVLQSYQLRRKDKYSLRNTPFPDCIATVWTSSI
jgi:hypothetical protein